MDINIGNSIKKLRAEKGITQEEIAEHIGVSFQAVSKWERGTTLPDIALLPKLAAFFGVRIDDLFSVGREDELERIDQMLAHEVMTDKNFTYAKRILDSILSENVNDIGAIKRYAELYLSKANRDLLSVASKLEYAMKLSPNDPEIFTLYRRACGGDRYTVASANEKFLLKSGSYASRNPKNQKLFEMLIEAAIDIGNYEKASELVNIMHLENDLQCLRDIYRGDIEAAKGNINAAISFWTKIPADSHKGQYEAGERFKRINKYDKAIHCFRNSFACATVPRDLSAVYSLAFLYEKLDRYNDSINAWQTIIDTLKNDYGITESETIDWANREIGKLKDMAQ